MGMSKAGRAGCCIVLGNPRFDTLKRRNGGYNHYGCKDDGKCGGFYS